MDSAPPTLDIARDPAQPEMTHSSNSANVAPGKMRAGVVGVFVIVLSLFRLKMPSI